MKGETGTSLLETIVALALLGIIAVVFLGTLATTSSARSIADEHASSRILAESQMENLKKQEYSSSYDPVAISGDYPGYTASVDVQTLRNGSIQKITVTIRHHNRDIESLESYKVSR